MNETNNATFSDAGGNELLWEAVALAKVVEGMILRADIDALDKAFGGRDHFDGNDMPSLASALRRKIEDIEKIADEVEK
jgi:hypothetical protein